MDPTMGGGMTPEQLQAYLDFVSGQGAFEEQDREIQRQLAQAQALRNRGQSQHTTGAGAMFGGMGDMLNAYTASRDTKAAQARDLQLQQQRIAALRAMAEANRPQPQPPEMLRRPDAFTPPYGGF